MSPALRTAMPESAAALQRAGLYRLLAELFFDEPDEPLLALAATVPELAGHATAEAARRYTHVFVLNAYPFASVYLDADGAVGGARAGFTRGVLEALGLAVEEGVAADHVAVLFAAASALLEREGAGQGTLGAERARHGQRTLLAEHVLPWAPHFLDAVGRLDGGTDAGLYAAAAVLARRLLTEHAEALFGGRRGGDVPPGAGAEQRSWKASRRHEAETVPASIPEAGAASSPAGVSPLADLTRPARCGFFLSRADIAAIAAGLELPIRFGGRSFMLDSVIQAAAQAGAGARLQAALTRFASGRRAVLEGWSADLPGLAPVWREPLARLDATDAAWRTGRPSRAPDAEPGAAGAAR